MTTPKGRSDDRGQRATVSTSVLSRLLDPSEPPKTSRSPVARKVGGRPDDPGPPGVRLDRPKDSTETCKQPRHDLAGTETARGGAMRAQWGGSPMECGPMTMVDWAWIGGPSPHKESSMSDVVQRHEPTRRDTNASIRHARAGM